MGAVAPATATRSPALSPSARVTLAPSRPITVTGRSATVARPSGTVTVALERPIAPQVTLPATALLERDGRSAVWVVTGLAVLEAVGAGDRDPFAGLESVGEGHAGAVAADHRPVPALIRAAMLKSFNISEWALSHRSFVWFLMAVSSFSIRSVT
jgi:hypothetical protein